MHETRSFVRLPQTSHRVTSVQKPTHEIFFHRPESNIRSHNADCIPFKVDLEATRKLTSTVNCEYKNENVELSDHDFEPSCECLKNHSIVDIIADVITGFIFASPTRLENN